jgi:hypothetical protein
VQVFKKHKSKNLGGLFMKKSIALLIAVVLMIMAGTLFAKGWEGIYLLVNPTLESSEPLTRKEFVKLSNSVESTMETKKETAYVVSPSILLTFSWECPPKPNRIASAFKCYNFDEIPQFSDRIQLESFKLHDILTN